MSWVGGACGIAAAIRYLGRREGDARERVAVHHERGAALQQSYHLGTGARRPRQGCGELSGQWTARRAHAHWETDRASQRFAEKSKCRTRSSRLVALVRYALIIWPICVVRSVRRGFEAR